MPPKWVLVVAFVAFAWAFAATPPREAGVDRGAEPKKESAFFAVGQSRRTATPSSLDALVLERDGGGQFHLTARVEGEDVKFLVDTGADVVALTVEEAERLGITVDRDSFLPLMRTASGTGHGAFVKLRTIEVAGVEFHDVDAVVMEGLEVNLLGQSVLRKLGQVSLEGDRMTIAR